MDDAPDGYEPPFNVYLVEFEDGGQVGGFTTEEAANELIQRLRDEGGWGPLHVNINPIHIRAEDWAYDR